MDDEEKVMTDDRENDWVYLEEVEEERARIEGKQDQLHLDWLDRVETMLSDEEKALVERTEDRVYIDMLLSNEDKARIEVSLSNEEFLALLEVKHS